MIHFKNSIRSLKILGRVINYTMLAKNRDFLPHPSELMRRPRLNGCRAKAAALRPRVKCQRIIRSPNNEPSALLMGKIAICLITLA
jgi:hypothetical protein